MKFKLPLEIDFNRWLGVYNLKSKEFSQQLIQIGWKSTASILGAYIVSTMVIAMISSGIVKLAISPQGSKKSMEQSEGNKLGAIIIPRVNYRDIRKSIETRNLFNSTGEFPKEGEGGPSAGDGQGKVFDINAACEKTAMPLTLIGTIVFNNSAQSVATIKESGVEDADVYKIGDKIFSNEEAIIAAIDRSSVVLNNKGVKECLEIKDTSTIKMAGLDSTASDASKVAVVNKENTPPAATGGTINLESAYVEKELGPGFATVLTKARLVPNPQGAGINGFKIFNIEGGSLFAKVGLQNGDIITKVNQTSLEQPEQGFSLYQAFQDEKEIVIYVLRNGSTPETINVTVK